ncbi:MAG: putative O-antigen export system ATP-binding protein [Cytophagaceae bacterium]|jgi:lipopolysaccharide transport system ATP-binding protein|nr:putative O-antigen export system ATP-binding protein [Cytophagaceae bacterium]
MKQPAIIVEGVSKVYKLRANRNLFFKFFANQHKSKAPLEIQALTDVSFSLDQGDVLGVIGGNGDGKSTLLKILSQVTFPSAGKVSLTGRVSSLLEIGTGFHSDLNGIDNIFINGTLLGMSKKEVEARLEEIVEFSGIGDLIHLPVKTYSSGMTMRLGFSVAAHLDSEILLLDEVFAVGDLDFQAKAISKIETLFKRGKTIVYVSHDIQSIRRLCTKCLILEKGRVKRIGEVDQIVNEYLQNNRPMV